MGILIAYGILSFIISLIQLNGGILNFVASLLSLFLGVVFMLGYTRMCLDAVEGKEPQLSSFQEQMPKFWKALGLMIIIGAAVVIWIFLIAFIIVLIVGATSGGSDFMSALASFGTVGILLFLILMIPLLYVALRLQFATIFLVDTDCGITEALRRSWEVTAPYVVPLILLWLVMVGLCIAGVIALIVGFIVAALLTGLMQIVAYKQLTGGAISSEV
ncbi:MAG: DUF975 family protein [Tannerellaceae bacterium]|nr:DUF975 family protein [Tannerellaceae bacterium]